MTDRLLIRVIRWLGAAGCLALVAAPIWDHWLYRNHAASAGASFGDEFVTPAQAAPRPASARPADHALSGPGPMAVIGGSPAIASIAGPAPHDRTTARATGPAAAPPVSVAPAAAVLQSRASVLTAPPARPRSAAGAVAANRQEATGGAVSPVPPRAAQPPRDIAFPFVFTAIPAPAPADQDSGADPVPPPADPTPADPADPGTPSGGREPARDTRDTQAPPPRLTLLPARATVAPGEVVVVKVNLSDALGVSSVPFHLKFDPARLEYLGARSGSAFNGTSLQPILMVAENPDRPGDVAFGLVLAGSSGTYSGSGDLAILEFRALQAGPSDLLIEDASIRGPISEPLAVESRDARVEVR